MDIEEALKTGAMALFEEKYGDRVRMVEIPGFSRELCGGTHTHRTGDIGLFVIVQETSVAAGVRRIGGPHGPPCPGLSAKAAGYPATGCRPAQDRSPAMCRSESRSSWASKNRSKRNWSRSRLHWPASIRRTCWPQAEEMGGARVLIIQVEADNPKVLREMNDQFKERMKSGVVVLGAAHDGKVFLLVGVTDDLTKRVHAGNLIKEIVKEVGGSGGGRPDMAQAGGNRPEKLKGALDLARKLVQEKLEN